MYHVGIMSEIILLPALSGADTYRQVLLKSPILLESDLKGIASDKTLGTKTFKSVGHMQGRGTQQCGREGRSHAAH